MTGANYWIIVGPAVFALAIVVWLWLTVRGARRRRGYGRGRPEQPDRGVVSGGRIQGDPAQVNRRDEAPRSG